MSMTDSPAHRGCPRWMKLLLILSLAANVAVAGLFIGHSIRPHEDDRGARGSDRIVSWVVDMVPEDRREFAMTHMSQARDRIGAARAQRTARLPVVLDAIRAEPFDPAALDAALDAMFNRSTSGRAILREHLITMLAGFTPAERAAFAERFAERLGERGERD